MRTKIVLWGSNDQDEKILLAVELVELENKVKVHTFKEDVATEEFYNQMMNLWRQGQPVPFPDGHEEFDRTLSMSEGLLPEHIKASNEDLINRARSEWHFVVLSAKLYSNYLDELEEIKDRVHRLSKYDSGIWEEMKAFWSKVQGQSREKNLFKEHAADLREKTNKLFSKMKSLRKDMNEEFEKVSREHVQDFNEKLADIEERIERGLGLQPIFNELKNLQKTFRNTDFTRKHRSEIWKRLDGAFKLVKAKKYGKHHSDGSSHSRIKRRYDGLLAAINKMQSSIKRDKSERDFQKKRIDTTDGQLELQIRQAKLTMIEERIQSKENKLQEMMKTKSELEKKLEKEREKSPEKSETSNPVKDTEKETSGTGKQPDAASDSSEVKTTEDSSEDSKNTPKATESTNEDSRTTEQGGDLEEPSTSANKEAQGSGEEE